MTDTKHMSEGASMYALAERLFPIPRSITGDGLRKTLDIIKEYIPIQITEVPTGAQVFDWAVPREWNVRDAYIIDPAGHKIASFKENPLHLVGYSIPTDQHVSLEELQQHLYSSEEDPDVIPYITSYYKERWGFCITHKERRALQKGIYRVFIDSELKEGSLTYGELIIPGETKEEILLSTYVCHPAMANDNISGISVAVFLARHLQSLPRKYTYRILFVPETIGAIAYLSKHHNEMRSNTIAGFILTCMGDERMYSFLPSPSGATLADRVARHVLAARRYEYKTFSYLQRGSDERQYCAPGIDLPVVSIMRSKYFEYPEYHTSADNLSIISAEGLAGSLAVLKECIDVLEYNAVYELTVKAEPQLGKRGLYQETKSKHEAGDMLNIIAFANGKRDLIEIADMLGVAMLELLPIVEQLLAAKLLVRVQRSGAIRNSTIVGIGIDTESIARFDKEFVSDTVKLRKIFTENELRYCLNQANPPQHLAVRFAAKEAVIKSLAEAGLAVSSLNDHRGIEIIRGDDNVPHVRIEHAQARDLHIRLSLSHGGEQALAVAIATKLI